MKKILLLCLSFLLFTHAVFAQLDTENGVLYLSNFVGESSLVYDAADNTLVIKKESAIKKFSLKKIKEGYDLKNDADSIEVFKFLGVSSKEVRNVLSASEGKSVMSKLLNIVVNDVDKEIFIRNASATGAQNDVSVNDTDNEEGAVNINQAVIKEENSSPWWIGLLAAVAGLIVGWIISKKTGKKTSAQHAGAVDHSEINILKQKLSRQADIINQKESQLEAMNSNLEIMANDESYYQAVFNKIILPLEKALDDGDEAKVAYYSNLAMVHFSSFTRFKIRKKQHFDDNNIQLMTEGSAGKEFPTLDGNTPVDKIPANLRTMMNVLKRAGVKDLGDTVFYGYYLKQI